MIYLIKKNYFIDQYKKIGKIGENSLNIVVLRLLLLIMGILKIFLK